LPNRQLNAWAIFEEIRPTEFMGRAWENNERVDRACNLRNMIADANDIATIAMTFIVSSRKLKDRVKYLAYFLRVANTYQELRNFHHHISLHAAISGPTLSRLQWTNDRLSKKSKQEYEEMQRIWSHDQNQSIYRDQLNKEGPCMPALAPILREMIHMEDIPARTLSGKINLIRVRALDNTLRVVIKHQDTPYDIQPIKDIQTFLSKAPRLSDLQLYQASIEIEPRGATRSEIE